MKKSEVVAVIAAMNVIDARVAPVTSPQDPRIDLFHQILAPYPAHQAVEAIQEYGTEPHMVVMQVGNVVQGIKAIRARNLARIEAADLIPPDDGLTYEDEDGRTYTRFPEWMRAAQEAIADGLDRESACQEADTALGASRRRALAPGSTRPLIEALRPVLDVPGQARIDVVAGELLVTERGECES